MQYSQRIFFSLQDKAAEILSVICEGFSLNKVKSAKLQDELVPMDDDESSPPTSSSSSTAAPLPQPHSATTTGAASSAGNSSSSSSNSRFRSDQIVSKMKMFFQGDRGSGGHGSSGSKTAASSSKEARRYISSLSLYVQFWFMCFDKLYSVVFISFPVIFPISIYLKFQQNAEKMQHCKNAGQRAQHGIY